MTPRLVNREKAAAYCGVSANTFAAHVEPHLAAVEIGTRRLFDVRAIDAWIDRGRTWHHIAVTADEWLARG